MTEQLPDLPERGRKPAANDAEMFDRLAPDPTEPPSKFEERTSTASYAVEVSDQDRLAEVKDTLRYWDQMYGQNGAVRLPPGVAAQEAGRHVNRAQIDWLIGQADQVERLRGLLGRLEWDANGYCTICDAPSPAQTGGDGHRPDCELAAALRST